MSVRCGFSGAHCFAMLLLAGNPFRFFLGLSVLGKTGGGACDILRCKNPGQIDAGQIDRDFRRGDLNKGSTAGPGISRVGSAGMVSIALHIAWLSWPVFPGRLQHCWHGRRRCRTALERSSNPFGVARGS